MKKYIKIDNLELIDKYQYKILNYYVMKRVYIHHCDFYSDMKPLTILLHHSRVPVIFDSCRFPICLNPILTIKVRFLSVKFGHTRRYIKKSKMRK